MTSFRLGLRRFRRAHARKRLARAVREHARAEYQHRVEAGGVDTAALDARTELYEALAGRLEALDRPVTARGTARLSRLVADRVPLFDYGPYARARDAELEAILLDLAREEKPRR